MVLDGKKSIMMLGTPFTPLEGCQMIGTRVGVTVDKAGIFHSTRRMSDDWYPRLPSHPDDPKVFHSTRRMSDDWYAIRATPPSDSVFETLCANREIFRCQRSVKRDADLLTPLWAWGANLPGSRPVLGVRATHRTKLIRGARLQQHIFRGHRLSGCLFGDVRFFRGVSLLF